MERAGQRRVFHRLCELQGVVQGQDAEVACMALSPDGTLLATGGSEKTVTLWDIGASNAEPVATAVRDAAFRVTPRSTLAGHTSSVFCLAFSRDGRWLASGSHDNTARLWSVADGSPKAVLAEHTGAVRAVAFSPDGKRLATGGSDCFVKLWDVHAAKSVATFEGQ